MSWNGSAFGPLSDSAHSVHDQSWYTPPNSRGLQLYSLRENHPSYLEMSEPSNVGSTLAGGIQDIAALLPLLGTDQCEKHVGSALDGGYLYAAAAPLSIFGSLGIVKVGIFVLVSCISIPQLSVSFADPRPKLSITFPGHRWLGARMLDNAGFKPVGTVSSLIAMDGKRYAAETRLMEFLKEKHIEDSEHLSVECESIEWNVMLIICTILAAGGGVAPYIPFMSPSFRSPALHSPWMFPLLRTVGSCLAVVCCQFLIQSRVSSLMKNRIIFMIMDHTPGVEDIKSKNNENDKDCSDIKDFRCGWDESLPSEECLSYLERCLLPTQVEASKISNPAGIRNKLRELQDKHIRTSSFDKAFILISWTILFLSLPATVAGYVGCFTLVSGSRGNGPLVWLGLEASLSIIRILLWAWNPSFDERTDIALRLELAKDQPLVTTEKNVELLKTASLPLVPERRFLEWITPYTGPLEQFQNSENLALYFTLTGNDQGSHLYHLYLTGFDTNRRIAVTLHVEDTELIYTDAVVTCNSIASEMEATLRSAMAKDHPWRTSHAALFDALSKYYFSLIHALNRSDPSSTTPDNCLVAFFRSLTANVLKPRTATNVMLPRKWNLLPKGAEYINQNPTLLQICLTEHDKSYLQQGYEHDLKTKLVDSWSSWIVTNIDFIRGDARYDCHHVLTDGTSEKAKLELIELDTQVASESRKREWSLLVFSFALEGILNKRMEICIAQIIKNCIVRINMEKRNGERLDKWMRSEFAIEQRKRLEKNRKEAMERMEKEMKISAELAEREGWEWSHDGGFSPKDIWEAGLEFIDEKWRGIIGDMVMGKGKGRSRLDDVLICLWNCSEDRRTVGQALGSRLKHWESQHANERLAMDATIERIRDNPRQLDNTYTYPKPFGIAVGRFVILKSCRSQAKVCSATVYDVRDCDEDIICDVIKRSTTQSVINMAPNLNIPENDHLLYLSFDPGPLQEPAFIQRNREEWWNTEKLSNSFTFFFSPQSVDTNNRYVQSTTGTIAHIFIYLQTQTRLRLRLLHFRFDQVSVSIRKDGRVLRPIDDIAEQLQPQDFELGGIGLGRNKLELVVSASRGSSYYGLRDIFVDFFK